MLGHLSATEWDLHAQTSHTLISCFPVAVATNRSILTSLSYIQPFCCHELILFSSPFFLLTKKEKVGAGAWRSSAGRCLAPDFPREPSRDKEIEAWPCERKSKEASVDKDGVYLPGGTSGDWWDQPWCEYSEPTGNAGKGSSLLLIRWEAFILILVSIFFYWFSGSQECLCSRQLY